MQARVNKSDFSNSLFQTGSGKMVNISSDGLARAKTLLGLVEDNDPGNFLGFQDIMKLSNTDSTFGWQNVSHLEISEGFNCSGSMDDASVPRSSSFCSTDLGQDRVRNEAKPQLTPPRMCNSTTKLPPVKFQTAGGRSISVSSDALQRARSLLGDTELGTFLDIGNADDSDFSLSQDKRLVDTLLTEKNDPQTSLTHHKMLKGNFMPKSFVSPLRSSSKQMQPSVSSGSINSGTNLIRQFDAVSHDNVCKLNVNLTCQQEPLGNGLCPPNTVVDNSLANSIGLRKNLAGRSLGRQLADISNTIGTASANDRQATNEKRRILRTSKSPFKRPRSSKFSTPIKSNVSFAPNGKIH